MLRKAILAVTARIGNQILYSDTLASYRDCTEFRVAAGGRKSKALLHFGFALELWCAGAIWNTAAMSFAALLAVRALRVNVQSAYTFLNRIPATPIPASAPTTCMSAYIGAC